MDVADFTYKYLLELTHSKAQCTATGEEQEVDRRGLGICSPFHHEVPSQGAQDGLGETQEVAPQDGAQGIPQGRISHLPVFLCHGDFGVFNPSMNVFLLTT